MWEGQGAGSVGTSTCCGSLTALVQAGRREQTPQTALRSLHMHHGIYVACSAREHTYILKKLLKM